MRKALIQDGRVHQILEADPFPDFHPDLLWVECGEEVKEGWIFEDGLFHEEDPPAPQEPTPALDPVEKLRIFLLANPDVAELIQA